jgi:hypothetical protein
MPGQVTVNRPIARVVSEIAANLQFADRLEPLVKSSKPFMLDILGGTLGAKHGPSGKIMANVVIGLGGKPRSTLTEVSQEYQDQKS